MLWSSRDSLSKSLTRPPCLPGYASGSVTVTPDHVILVDGKFAPARTAAVGSTLRDARGAELTIRSVSSSYGRVVNPITTSGTILAAAPDGGAAVVASVYGEWIYEAFLGPADLTSLAGSSLSATLSAAFPASAQAFHDALVEPIPHAYYGLVAGRTPVRLYPLVFLLLDVLMASAFGAYVVCSLAGGATTLAAPPNLDPIIAQEKSVEMSRNTMCVLLLSRGAAPLR